MLIANIVLLSAERFAFSRFIAGVVLSPSIKEDISSFVMSIESAVDILHQHLLDQDRRRIGL